MNPSRWKNIACELHLDIPDSDMPCKKIIKEIKLVNWIGLRNFPEIKRVKDDLFQQYKNIMAYIDNKIDNKHFVMSDMKPEIMLLLLKTGRIIITL